MLDNIQRLVYITPMNEEKCQEIKEFMDLEEVATYLNVSISTIYRYIKDRNNPLPTFQISKQIIRVKKEDLDSWLENYKKGN